MGHLARKGQPPMPEGLHLKTLMELRGIDLGLVELFPSALLNLLWVIHRDLWPGQDGPGDEEARDGGQGRLGLTASRGPIRGSWMP